MTFTALTDGVAGTAVSGTSWIREWGFGGNSQCKGGMDAKFQWTAGGCMKSDYYCKHPDELQALPPIAGAFGLAGEDQAQYWLASYDGNYDGDITLTFSYDDSLLGEDEDERLLAVWHYNGSEWEELPTLDRDRDADLLTVLADGFSPFVLGYLSRLPGDCDGDGDVDFLDYITLKRNFGREGEFDLCDGDFDGNDQVNEYDFLMLKDYFGLSLEQSGPAAHAPEPTALCLLAVGGLALLRRRRNRRTRR